MKFFFSAFAILLMSAHAECWTVMEWAEGESALTPFLQCDSFSEPACRQLGCSLKPGHICSDSEGSTNFCPPMSERMGERTNLFRAWQVCQEYSPGYGPDGLYKPQYQGTFKYQCEALDAIWRPEDDRKVDPNIRSATSDRKDMGPVSGSWQSDHELIQLGIIDPWGYR